MGEAMAGGSFRKDEPRMDHRTVQKDTFPTVLNRYSLTQHPRIKQKDFWNCANNLTSI